MTGRSAPLPEWLGRGRLVLDTASDRVGIVHGVGSPYRLEDTPSEVWLLPPGGGYEWRVDIRDVRPAPGQEADR